MSSSQPADRRLEVSARAVARFWDMSLDAVRQAGEAGLLGSAGRGFDADRVLELTRRPYVDEDELRRLPPGSVLLVQQSARQPALAEDFRTGWREFYGWDVNMSEQEALLSACAWWPVGRHREGGVLGVVSSVSSFVVTIGVVDRDHPISEHRGNKVRFNLLPPDGGDPTGARLLAVFERRRLAVRSGSSLLVP